MSELLKPRRSVLYVPGSNSRALQKAADLGADCLVLDLEDAVAPEFKAQARSQVSAFLSQRPASRSEFMVRVNGADTPWFADDLAEVLAYPPRGLVFPKVRSAEDLRALDDELSERGAAPGLELWAMIELPEAILRIRELAEMAQSSRLACFLVGTNDLAKELSIRVGPDRKGLLTALSSTVLAACAYGIGAIDGVFNDISDADGFEAECLDSLGMGFHGKSLIHPSQISRANEIFAPAEDELEEAKAIIAAFELAENLGKGVIVVNGKMTERLHLERARALVAKSDAIAGLAAP
ncbi:MAG: CoA ester lyase [Pseudomonadota bacterium]